MKYYLIRFKYAIIDRGIRRERSRTEQDRIRFAVEFKVL